MLVLRYYKKHENYDAQFNMKLITGIFIFKTVKQADMIACTVPTTGTVTELLLTWSWSQVTIWVV